MAKTDNCQEINISSLPPSDLKPNENATIDNQLREKSPYRLVVLMASHEFSPTSINRGHFNSTFGETNQAHYLISKQRQSISAANDTLALSPEEIQKRGIGHPDFKLLPPQSAAAQLQRYLVLSYRNKKQLDKAKAALLHNPNVTYISEVKNDSLQLLTTANDPLSLNIDQFQYGLYSMELQNTSMSSAWDRVEGHAYVGIADSGLDIGHPDFLGSFRSHFSWNFDANNNDVTETPWFSWLPNQGHGQHVSGIIAADSNNGLGTTGICWHCSTMFAKVRNDSDMIAGYQLFANEGAQVINSSFSNSNPALDCTSQPFDPACTVLQLLADHDVVHVAAAGNGTGGNSPLTSNGRNNFIQFPASDSRTIAVGASNFAGQRAGFSDHGPQLDIVAPGVNILSTFVRNQDWEPAWNCGDNQGIENEVGYGTCTGTSMAAPHVTGLVALIRSVDPLLNRLEVKNILETSSSEYPIKDAELGYGIPDALLAVEQALGTVNGAVLHNRLTPLFSFYSTDAEDSFYTTVPQMATAAVKGTVLPQPASSVNYLPNYGSSTPYYTSFPDFGGLQPGPAISPTPQAESYIFTTKTNPLNASQALAPLYRMSYQGANGNNGLNMDHFYTTDQALLTAAGNAGYTLDGTEGYIFSNAYPKPAGTVGLYSRYNPTRDDHAIFPEGRLSQMTASGYTWVSGTDEFIDYAYVNQDSDNDYLVDGFESLIGTCINNSDSNGNNISDGVEVLDYPRTDPVSGSCASAPSSSHPWQDNATGSQVTGIPWNYALGYHFTPLVNGTIDQLGGLFNGTKQIKLFNKTTGQLLAQVTVSAANNWNYANISPINVQANQSYTVAVYMAGAGASYKYSSYPLFPMIVDGNFKIDSSTFADTGSQANSIPTNNAHSHYMFGQADVRFNPN